MTAIDDRGVQLDQTVFYPVGGGQPGDTGALILADGSKLRVTNTFKDRDTGEHIHALEEGATVPSVGDVVTAEIDWDRRYRLMRMHSALHLLCATIDGGVTGGQIGEEKSRLDFDLPDTNINKEAIGQQLNDLVSQAQPMSHRWITTRKWPRMKTVRTMSVKPPSRAGKVRLMEIAGRGLTALWRNPCREHVRNR